MKERKELIDNLTRQIRKIENRLVFESEKWGIRYFHFCKKQSGPTTEDYFALTRIKGNWGLYFHQKSKLNLEETNTLLTQTPIPIRVEFLKESEEFLAYYFNKLQSSPKEIEESIIKSKKSLSKFTKKLDNWYETKEEIKEIEKK